MRNNAAPLLHFRKRISNASWSSLMDAIQAGYPKSNSLLFDIIKTASFMGANVYLCRYAKRPILVNNWDERNYSSAKGKEEITFSNKLNNERWYQRTTLNRTEWTAQLSGQGRCTYILEFAVKWRCDLYDLGSSPLCSPAHLSRVLESQKLVLSRSQEANLSVIFTSVTRTW